MSGCDSSIAKICENVNGPALEALAKAMLSCVQVVPFAYYSFLRARQSVTKIWSVCISFVKALHSLGNYLSHITVLQKSTQLMSLLKS